jgi:hypothetical protein
MAPRRTAKTGKENVKTANHPWIASFKGNVDRLYFPINREEGV